MMSNKKKFVDRNPSILAAGKSSDRLGSSVACCLREYTLDDAASALRYVANIDEKGNKSIPKAEPYRNRIRKGIYTEIRPILQPQVKTRYNTLINELKETTYESHWNRVVGKGRDPIPGLPKGLNPLETTFGVETKKNESAKELINPSKNVYQVLSESQIGHELYKKTHNDYNVGERVCRNYLSPPFDEAVRFGERSKYDPRGIWVRCACTWHRNEPVVFTNRTQAHFFNQKRSGLGEVLRPNGISEKLSADFAYGKPSGRDPYSVEDLLKDPDCPPCQFKRDLKTWLTSYNKLRMRMRKFAGPESHFSDLYKRLLYYDHDKCGTLPLDVFYEICSCYRLTFDRENVEPLLRLLSIICDGKINYGRFLEAIDHTASPVELVKVQDVPEKNQYYLSSSRAAVCDYLIINNTEHNAAGIPSIRYDLPRPIVPNGGCRADLDNLGDECSAAILINPSIYCNYGLSFRDFFIPRERHVIRSLFENVGYQIDNETFEKLWKIGVDQDKTGLICVDTFNKLLLSHCNNQKILMVDEATC